MLTLADVFVDKVNTFATILAGVAMALIELVFAAIASVARLTVASITGNAIYASTMVAWVRLTIINVALTQSSFKTFSTSAFISIRSVNALGSILARSAGALINVDLTHGASKPWLTGAGEAVDHISTDAIIYAGVALAFINVHLTVLPLIARHTDACELANAVQAGGIVLARHGQTLVDINLAARASVAPSTLALERAFSVYTLSKMLTGVGTNGTFIHVLVAGTTNKASRAGADCPAIQWVSVTYCTLIAGVTDTSIIQMTEQTSFAHRALAEKRGHTVMTCGPVEADSCGTVVNVFTAVIPSPAIDAYTGVPSNSVEACTTIVTSIGLHETLVDILSTVLACPLRRALAIICVDTIDADPIIHAFVSRAVINIVLTIVSPEAWQTSTFVGVVTGLMAGAAVETL